MLLPRKWIKTSTFIMLFGCLDQFLVHRDADNKGSTCHSKVVYIFAMCPSPPKKKRYWPYLSLQRCSWYHFSCPERQFRLFSSSVSRGKLKSSSFFLRTHWSPQRSRGCLSANLNNCSGPELLMLILVVVRFKWQIFLIHSFKFHHAAKASK